MLKKILLASIFGVFIGIIDAFGVPTEMDKKTVASKAYVDTMIETKQLKIPAAGQPNVDAGETVMTYTATGNGEIGERGLYSDISSYDATTDADKLITASALNATFTNLPTTPTTKLECANQADGCTLWTIVDQSAYGKSKNLFDKDSIERGKRLDDSGNITTEGNGYVSADIRVMPNTTYTWQQNTDAGIYLRICEYDSTGFIKLNKGTTFGKQTLTFTTHPNTTYLKVSSKVTNLGTQQLEQGSAATSYEPY